MDVKTNCRFLKIGIIQNYIDLGSFSRNLYMHSTVVQITLQFKWLLALSSGNDNWLFHYVHKLWSQFLKQNKRQIEKLSRLKSRGWLNSEHLI